MNSVVLIIPDSIKSVALKTAWALGFQDQSGDTFAMPASANGVAPATYWYARGQSNPHHSLLLQAAKAGEIPPAPASGGTWIDYGLTLADLQTFASELITDCKPWSVDFDQVGHITSALATHGLLPVVATPPLP